MLVGSYQSAHVSDIAVSGSYAYIISDIRPEDIDETGFTIIDISNPSAPIFKGYLEFSKSTYAIAVSGNYAYMASETGLMIIDITNPSTPTITNSYDTGWVGDIIVEGNYAYISNSIALSILDITDSSLPQLVGSYPIENVSCIAVENNYIYVVSESSGLSILHVNNVPSIDQTTTTSYAVNDDNRLRESSPSSVLSTSSYIDLGKSTSRCRDVMAFNLSGYETTGTIDKATLSLYWYYPAGATRTSDTVVEIYRPMEWDPKYVSWKNSASGKAWTNAGGSWYDKNGVPQGTTPYAFVTFSADKVPDNKYYEFDVTDLVQEYINGTYDNTGFFLKAKDESGNYIAFYSSDWLNAAQIPKLTITSTSGSGNVTPVDELPVANAGDDITATTGSAVSFDASASTDDKGIYSYSWDFDVSDGITSEATGVTATKTYASPGTYTVTLTVTDTAGQESTDTMHVIVSSSSSSVTYSPLYDNRLRESSSSTVLSTTGYIDVGKSTSISRDVMIFDLSDYETTAKISKATLSLYWYYPVDKTRTSDTVVEIYRPMEWDPKYVSWKNSASGKAWTNAGGSWYDKNGVPQGTTPYASVTFSASKVPDNKYYEFDVTDLVQEYISGESKNTGFLLKAKTENGNYIAFYSSDWTNAEQRPKLTITS